MKITRILTCFLSILLAALLVTSCGGGLTDLSASTGAGGGSSGGGTGGSGGTGGGGGSGGGGTGSSKSFTVTSLYNCLGFADCLALGFNILSGVSPGNLAGTTTQLPTSLMGFTASYEGFTSSASLTAYSSVGSVQGQVLPVTLLSDAALALLPQGSSTNVFWGMVQLPDSGLNTVTIGGSESGESASATATVTWSPGGHADPIDIRADFVVPMGVLSTDDASLISLAYIHFIKPGGTFTAAAGAVDDCNFFTCEQGVGALALDWTTNPGTATTADDVSTDAIARLDQFTPTDAAGNNTANYQTAWIAGTANVAPNVGDFLLCADALQIGTKEVTLSTTVTLKGVKETAVTRSSTTLSSIDEGDVWFIGRITRAADGTLTWTPVDTVVPAAGCI